VRTSFSSLDRKLDCPSSVLTKIVWSPSHLLPLIDTLTKQFNFAEIIPVSARKRDGLDILSANRGSLADSERYYPKTSTRPAAALHGAS